MQQLWKPILILVLGLSLFALAQSAQRLILNGQVASTRVIVVQGTAYVPLADVAKALGQTVVRVQGGYEIRAAGGANQLAGQFQGKVGDQILTGLFRVQIQKVERMESYTTRFDKNNLAIQPRSAEEELVVITASLRNAKQSGTVAPSLSVNNPGNTALAGADGRSFPPIAYDSPSGTNTGGGFTLLPGAALNFAVVFSVPKGTEVKALVLRVGEYGDTGSKDVRVSL
ncbi:hypothetical protein [Meiothermus sp. CFH 77666]|uniref:hypothetical protein n=1 Tax=Meiothermus sp. CFH 77666 TaxID=2817942 RepID=UPI001AA049B8|nr:hypothetical protein [Meiothermus sp. CFH 77666]MBO1438499.1 hypothetical protein [Meiothermus sp. CFH 77666]